jgi:hypothetical protein
MSRTVPRCAYGAKGRWRARPHGFRRLTFPRAQSWPVAAPSGRRPAEEMEECEGRHARGRICGGEERAADRWEGGDRGGSRG